MATGCESSLQVKGMKTCEHHHGIGLTLFCETCDKLVCSKCLNSFHREHALTDLGDIIPERKRQLQTHVDELEGTEYDRIKDTIGSIHDEIEAKSEHFEKLIKEVQNQGELLTEEIHVMTTTFVSLYTRLKEEGVRNLTTYQGDLQRRLDRLGEHVLECRNTLKQGTNIDVFYTTEEIKTQRTFPMKPSLIADFQPNKAPQNFLEQAFGILTTTGYRGAQFPMSAKKRTTIPRSPDLAPIVPLSEFDSTSYIDVICPASDDKAWISYCTSNSVILLNDKGEEQQRKEFQQRICDITLSPKTDHIWACCVDSCDILEWDGTPSTEPIFRFRTKREPYALCATVDDEIIVGLPKQLMKCTRDGKLLSSDKSSWFFRPAVRTPYKIAECCLTRNLAVVDRDNRNDGGYGKENVVLLDKHFNEIFRYTGIQASHPHSDVAISGRLPFGPRDVAFSNTGCIVVADHFNCSLHLLSSSGMFLRVVYTDKALAVAAAISNTNVLWGVFGGRRVMCMTLD